MNCSKSRGTQIKKGFESGKADLVLFLHADSTVNESGITELLSAFNKNNTLAWGVLGHGYKKASLNLRFINLLNKIRFYLSGIAFGDQGIFARRIIIEKNGGFPDIPIMEDVELSLRLFIYPGKKLGHLIEVSARRWAGKNFIGKIIEIFVNCFIYLILRALGFNINKISLWIFRKYYSLSSQ